MARKAADKKTGTAKRQSRKKAPDRTRTGFRRVSFDADGRHIVFQRKKKVEKTLAQKIASIKARIKAPKAQERAIRIAKGEIDFYGRPKKPKPDMKEEAKTEEAEAPAPKRKRAPRRKTAQKAAAKPKKSTRKPRRKKSSGSDGAAMSFSWNW